MNKILIVFGTRPELIKLAPIINEFQSRNQRDRIFIVNTSQHRTAMLEDIADFNIQVDYEFTLNRNDDSLSHLNGVLLLEFYKLHLALQKMNITIKAIIGQGDTCTTFSSAQFAFYENIPFLHVEAGLRTYDFHEPFPEEYYRRTISTLSHIHFAPTSKAKDNLIAEGIPCNRILLIGNTVIDNLRIHFQDHSFQHPLQNGVVLITIHRRENIKETMHLIIDRILTYCKNNPEKIFVWIDNPGYKIQPLIHTQLPNLHLIPPVSFREMMNLYKKTRLIITDSGGIQEEAAYLGIPALIFRAKTERIEGIYKGVAKYMDDCEGDLDFLITELNRNKPCGFNHLYGDGFASQRIVDFLLNPHMSHCIRL